LGVAAGFDSDLLEVVLAVELLELLLLELAAESFLAACL
jgi:hypothetical protein